MAEGYSVGNLKIAFDALDKTGDSFKTLKANIQAISHLIGNISTANLGKFTANVTALTRAFSPFLQRVNDAKDGVSQLNETLSYLNVNGVSTVAQSIDGIQGSAEGAANTATEMNGTMENGQADVQQAILQTTQAINAQVGALNSSIKGTNKLAASTKSAGKEAEKAANGGFSKLIDRVGRVALYRTIRRGLQMITQTFTSSIQAYAQVDDRLNNTMSQLTSSTKVISLSLGTMIFPILQAITPVVQSLSVGFANMANVINASMAKMQGLSTYTKINANAMKDYRKQINKTSGALADFDKFRALSGEQKDSSVFLEEAEVESVSEELGNSAKVFDSIYYMLSGIAELFSSVLSTIKRIGESEVFQTAVTVVSDVVGGLTRASSWVLDIADNLGLIEPILGGILGYLTAIGVTKIITALSSTALFGWLKAVVGLLREDFSGTLKMLSGDLMKVLSSTKALALGIGALGGSIMYLVANWDKMSETGRTLTITLSIIAAAIVGVTTALVAFHSAHLGLGAAIKAAATAAAITGAIGIAIGTAASTAKNATNVAAYANGGIPDKGSLFVAGEHGAEFVYNMPSGQSGVANVQQIAQAVYQGSYQATMDWWKTAKNEIGGDVYLDGEQIYRNTTSHAKKHGNTWKKV